jgi:hypothetical protein
MSLGGMAGITARPTKYTSLTLVGLQNFGPEIPGLPSDYLHLFAAFIIGFVNIGFGIVVYVWSQSLNLFDIPRCLIFVGMALDVFV